MVKVTGSIQVERSVEETFDYAADWRNEAQWNLEYRRPTRSGATSFSRSGRVRACWSGPRLPACRPCA